MTVAHLGPPLGRTGGPGGYLAQLAGAIAHHGDGGHTVLLPAPAPPRTAASASPFAPVRQAVRRVRRTVLGAPSYYRPSSSELLRSDGEIGRMISQAWREVVAEVEPALVQAIEAHADVIFAHDAPSAQAALERRAPGQQVWLMLHNPMPLALYLAWCWGVPDRAWDEVASYPDVQRWTADECGVIERVDRVFIPCAEAVDELVRAAPSFGRVLSRAEFLLTGAAGPVARRALDGGRRSWGLPVDRPVGLFLGNAQPYRGLDVLLAGLERLPQRGTPAGVVAVAGCPVDQLPIRPRLRALGHVADVGGLLAAVDFVINVNRFSLFDLSTIEALEAGRPLLLHETGGNRTFGALGAGAMMLPSLDPQTIATGLMDMFVQTPEALARLGAESRACYERHLTPRHLHDRHLALYNSAGARAEVGR